MAKRKMIFLLLACLLTSVIKHAQATGVHIYTGEESFYSAQGELSEEEEIYIEMVLAEIYADEDQYLKMAVKEETPVLQSETVNSVTPVLNLTVPTLREKIVYHAKSLNGSKYVREKEEMGATDCSGVVYYAYNQAGIKLPRSSSLGYHRLMTPLKREDLKPGDVVTWERNRKIVHIQVYIGTATETVSNPELVHDAVVNAPGPGRRVYIVSLSKFEKWMKTWKPHFGRLYDDK